MEDEEFHEKCGSFVLDLSHRKQAMLFNVFYMFRRIALAFIIVVLPNLNWLQRQLLIVKCACLMLFTGSVKPFFHNY